MSVQPVSASSSNVSDLSTQAQGKPKAPPGQPAQPSTPAQSSSPLLSVAVTAAAAIQEATETATVTSQEARKGDHQALRLLQKQAAAAPSVAPTVNSSGQVIGNIFNTVV